MMITSKKHQNFEQEVANVITHGLGLIIAIPALILIIILSFQNPFKAGIGAIIYGLSLCTMYLSSTLYHGVQEQKLKRALQKFDHMAIYFLIAGSYTPFILIYLSENKAAIAVLWALWIIAFAGILFKIFFTGRFKLASTLAYIAMGWMALFIIKPIFQNIPFEIVQLFLAGGLSYTIGTIFYVWRGLYYHHAIWHLFVMAGASFHYYACVKALGDVF